MYYIQEIPNNLINPRAEHVLEETKPEIKTTVDLTKLDLRSEEQNTIRKIEWVHWAGERQAFVTLADGKTLFFDEFAHGVNSWKVGDPVRIYKEGHYYYASSGGKPAGRLEDYSLSPDRHDYWIETQDANPTAEVLRCPYILPEDFKVYAYGDIVINWNPGPPFEEVTLPSYIDYQGYDGGYVAIYTRDPKKILYSVGGGIGVMGQVRVQGHYKGRIFVPTGYKLGDNITQDPDILEICGKYFDMKDAWIGGDTGGWF